MKIVMFVLFLAISVCGQTPADQMVPQEVAFVAVDRVGEATARSFFVFSTGVRSYAIRHDGHAEAAPLAGNYQNNWRAGFRKNFDLRLGGAAQLERIYFAEFGGDLLLEYEVKAPRGNWGYILRMDQKTMGLKWITPVSGDTLGPGLIDRQELYISGANMLAKIDLRNGAYLWQQSELERFYSFSVPAIKGDSILFRDESASEKTIEVDRQTGRLIKN